MNSIISNCTFQRNLASYGNGGALFLSCSNSNTKDCQFTLSQNTFSSNIAGQSGGAVYYDSFEPLGLLANNTYSENFASYGDNYASYPVALYPVNMTSGTPIKMMTVP